MSFFGIVRKTAIFLESDPLKKKSKGEIMTKYTENKRRFSALIHENTYNKVKNFVKENELITTRLTPGTVLEIGLNLFFKELEKRPLEEIAVEYLIDNAANDGDSE